MQLACKRLLALRRIPYVDTSQPFRAAITPGLADLIVLVPGRGVLFVECKAPTGRLAPAQQDFAAACAAAGVPYVVVRAAADLAAVLDAMAPVLSARNTG